jgi:chromosomal replication initiator protein
MSRPNFDTWLRDTSGLDLRNGVFTVGTSSAFINEWLQSRHYSLIKKTLAGILHEEIEVEFVVHHPDSPQIHHDGTSTEPARAAGSTTATPVPKLAASWTRLNPRYTFDNFIVGDGNRLAHAASTSVAEKPGSENNPLFIYSSTGLGKTHLLHAIGHLARQNNYYAVYVTSEQFTNEFIASIREQKSGEFRSKYRSVDVLLIDDIQFIAGKESTQEGFFHTFNDLHLSGRQIVISSDRTPQSMPSLEDRLRSRFEGGLLADMQPPDFETRLAILQTKAHHQGIAVNSSVLEFIAQRVQTNIRDLEGCLNRVIAYSRLTGNAINPDMVSQLLSDSTAAGRRKQKANPTLILDTVSEAFQLSLDDLRGRRRTKHIAWARQVAMYLMREEAGLPLARIGRELGGRDPATIVHGCDKVNQSIETDPQVRRVILDLREELNDARFHK